MSVENLYGLQGSEFMISFWTSGVVDGQRSFAHYNSVTKKLTIFDPSVCIDKNEKKISVLSHVFPSNQGKFICLRYAEQKWEVGQGQENVWQSLYTFKSGEQIYSSSFLNESGKQKFSYYSEPRLPAGVTETMGAFKKQVPKVIDLEISKNTQTEVSSQNLQALSSERPYSLFTSFYPNHLLLEYFSSGTVDSYGLSTSLSDPRMIHSLSGLVLYNDGLGNNASPYSGNASYLYGPDDWSAGAFYSKYRFQFPQDSGNVQRLQEQQGVAIDYEWQKTYWEFKLGSKIQRSDESDPYASRKLHKGSLYFVANHQDLRSSSQFKSMLHHLESGVAENVDHDTYPWLEYSLKNLWQWDQDWRTHFNLQYGKQWVEEGSGLRDGTFYAGGTPTVFSLSFPFPSYLLNYGSLLGTEVVTAQLRQDWTFAYPFSGNGLIPFYLKSLSAIGGLEYLHGDKMFYDYLTENDPRLWVGFMGAKFDTQLLFLLPVDIEVVYAKSLDSRRTRSNLSIMFQSSITF